MKSTLFKLIFPAVLLLLSACSSGKPAPVIPRHHKTAVNEIIKGNHLYKKGCYEMAIEHFFKAHELFSTYDNQGGVAKSLNNIGNIYRATDKTESAALFYSEAVTIYMKTENYKGAVQALSNKAAAYIDAGILDLADVTLDRAEAVSEKHSVLYAPAINNRGILMLKQNNPGKAEILMNRALANTSEDSPFEYASVNYSLGTLMAEKKEFNKAIDFFSRALEADRKSNLVKGIADDLLAIGSVYLDMEEFAVAADYLQRSLKMYTLLGHKTNSERAVHLLDNAVTAAGENKPDTAITTHFIKQWSEGKILTNPCNY